VRRRRKFSQNKSEGEQQAGTHRLGAIFFRIFRFRFFIREASKQKTHPSSVRSGVEKNLHTSEKSKNQRKILISRFVTWKKFDKWRTEKGKLPKATLLAP
jgi:hypothetical protein